MLPANAASVVESAEARQLPALIAEWEVATDERHWLARALRVDLALVTAHPGLALACLAARCAHDPIWYAYSPPVPAEAARAAELAAAWATGTPRLRALRPPPVPLVGGVREEYRTSLAGELCASADGLQLGVTAADGAAISWDRTSGRRTDGAADDAAFSGAWFPLRPLGGGPRWTIGRDSTWCHLVLVGPAGEVRALDLGAEVIARAVRTLDATHVIVELDDLDGGARHDLVELGPAPRIAWTADGDCRAAVLAAGQVVCAGTRGVAIRDLRTGDHVFSWTCPPVDALARLADGALVTRSGPVLRVWEPGARGGELAATYGWTTAQFSPAGDRLVTGGNLCDARTGAHLARMTVNGPGWLEGGPPAPCQALVAGAFVELQPFGLRVWESGAGQLIIEDRTRSARHDDIVAFDPTGAHYALARRATGALSVVALAGGAVRIAHGIELARGQALGFTADGRALWWHDAEGRRWLHPLAGTHSLESPRLLGPDEPTPSLPAAPTIAVRDGLLAIGELAAPCDDPEVTASPDGRAYAARRSHYIVES